MCYPVVPQFRWVKYNFKHLNLLNETITSHQYRTGYTFSVSGHNIESADIDGYINPTPTSVNQQTVGGVNFSWTTLDGSTNARWKISNPANSSVYRKRNGVGFRYSRNNKDNNYINYNRIYKYV